MSRLGSWYCVGKIWLTCSFPILSRIARATATLLDPSLTIPDEAIILDERFHEGIYGIPGPSTMAAIATAAQTDAMITDPVYEGKSMAGLIKLVEEGSIKEGSNVVG